MGVLKYASRIKNSIKKSKAIFLMAHKNLDLDALGSCIGLYTIIKKRKKNCFIIIDDKRHEKGVEKVLIELEA